MTFGSIFGRTFSPTFQPKSQAVASSWWLAGGIAAANCIAAYQPKGAADYAASKVNLANVGTHTLVDYTTYPDWYADTGWYFNGGQALKCTTLLCTNESTIIARFSNANRLPSGSGGTLFGDNKAGLTLHPYRHKYLYDHVYSFKTIVNVANQIKAGVMAVSKDHGYLNGSVDCDLTGAISGNTQYMFIGAAHHEGAPNVPTYLFHGDIQSISFYNNTLTDAQVAAVSTAMAAL